MANQSTANQIYICHFCSDEFSNRATLFAHFSHCQIKNSTKSTHHQPSPRLTQTQLDILHRVKLRSITNQCPSKILSHQSIDNINLQIPLSTLYSHGYLSSSTQLSFDDTFCNLDENFIQSNDINEEPIINKLSSYHIYKYSQRERRLYYSRIKHNYRIKKKSISPKPSPLLSNSTNYSINLPTKIHSRQRINSNFNHHNYPLLFTPNFHTLVQLPDNYLLNKYYLDIQISFHLLNSIASQEFQLIVHNYDNQDEYSYTFLNLLQQTMNNYTRNHHQILKRNYFDVDDEHESNHELVIPPLKIRRHDDSSYEIEKSSSSSSSSMSITQINNGHSSDDRRQRYSETRSKQFPSRISDIQLNSNSNDNHDLTVGSLPNDSLPKYQSVVLNEGARIRIVNCSNDSNNKQRNSMKKSDENYLTKSTRLNTRKISSTNSKTPDILEINPTYQAQSVLLSNDDISKSWLTHNVFYRCHACSHEEFFVVLSRECMRLHVSSKHGNMEENFKQRISNFLNNQGRALKIFQHYLKWQQPWSETEIDQIFQLANINHRTNGAS